MLPFKNNIKKNRGMTYVELIVVLSIFSVMTAVVLFNYNKFQAQVDIKNLANDMAIRIAEAQRNALSGKLPARATGTNWKPAYGVYFNLSTQGSNKAFVTFVDFNNQDGFYSDNSFCNGIAGASGECLEKINITKGNYISDITVYNAAGAPIDISQDLSITFTRPNSGAIIKSAGVPIPGLYAVVVGVSSPSGVTSYITTFASGRIEMNSHAGLPGQY